MHDTPISVVGKTYGRLTVVSASGRGENLIFLCRCTCGAVIRRKGQHIKRGDTRSCGCLQRDQRAAARMDLIGKVFGHLTVTALKGVDARKALIYECLCSCGNRVVVRKRALVIGARLDCGCKNIMTNGLLSDWLRRKSRGGYEEISKTRWNQIVAAAKQRRIAFEIGIEEAWQVFLKQDRTCALSGLPIRFGNNRFRGTASLDRIDPKLPYTINNVQWTHRFLNMMKAVHPNDRFLRLCRLVALKHPGPTEVDPEDRSNSIHDVHKSDSRRRELAQENRTREV